MKTTKSKAKPASTPPPPAPTFQTPKATLLIASHSITLTSSTPIPADTVEFLKNFLPVVAATSKTNIELIATI